MPTLRINGVEIATSGPMTILEAAKSAGIEIPHYCYHPGLSIVGQCRMCQVEWRRCRSWPRRATRWWPTGWSSARIRPGWRRRVGGPGILPPEPPPGLPDLRPRR